jgi:hypothetical protein
VEAHEFIRTNADFRETRENRRFDSRFGMIEREFDFA